MDTHANLSYISDGDFESQVLKSDTPVIVDFWAEWCGPCRYIAPTFEKWSDEYQGKIKFAKLNVDENPVVPERLRIQGIPTFIIFNHGDIAARIVGADPNRLKKEIDRIIG